VTTGPGRPPLPGPGPPSVARCTGQCAGRDDGRKCRPGPYREMADRSHLGPRLGRERPAPLRGAGSRPRGAATWRGPRWDARAVPPPSDAGPAPTASTNGGTYTRRYRDQKHVNELGHRKLPLGVVPAPVYLQTDLGAVTGRVLSSVIAMTGLLGDRLVTPMPAAWSWSPRPRNPPSHVVAAGSLSPRGTSRSRVNISTACCPTTAPAGPDRRASQTGP
jgi:hypothetical protein